MTNEISTEALVSEIQSGHLERMAELWERVQRFIRQQAHRAIAHILLSHGVTVEDLEQSGYFALCDAVKSFLPQAGCTFRDGYPFISRQHLQSAVGIVSLGATRSTIP